MKLYDETLFFGSSIANASSTPKWGTDLGEERPDLKIIYPGADVVLKGMDYKSIPLYAVSCNMKKGGSLHLGTEAPDFRKAALFTEVYINGQLIGYPFALLLLSDQSDSWFGRLILKYSPRTKVYGNVVAGKTVYVQATKSRYDNNQDILASNEEFFNHARNALGLSADACWFVHEITVVNQNELHMTAVIVDAVNSVQYPTAQARKSAWSSLITPPIDFDPGAFVAAVNSKDVDLSYDEQFVKRFVAALQAKPFVVLTGLSGSGKTKLAQAFAKFMQRTVAEFSTERTFRKGDIIQAPISAYEVVDADRLGVIIKQGPGTRTFLPYELIEEVIDAISTGHEADLVDYLKTNGSPSYSPNMLSFHAPLKALAKYIMDNVAWVQDSAVTNLLVPVGADWTNSEKLLGYPNALDRESYVMPDSGVLKLMMDAERNPQLPFFLILDEMNLSHVERYFADFLSAMESGDEIKLYDGDQRYGDKEKTIAVPRRIRVPKNLFVIGTMNVDETTYMFSPKVLDRAQVIEFRVSKDAMSAFLDSPTTPNLSAIEGKGAQYAEAFLKLKDAPPALDKDDETTNKTAIGDALKKFFVPLAELGAEFGYRTAGEVIRFCQYYLAAGATIDDAIDAAIVQKLLPKLHGSQQRLGPVLRELKKLASKTVKKMEDGEQKEVQEPLYKLTCEKIGRMQARLKANGFTSFAEA